MSRLVLLSKEQTYYLENSFLSVWWQKRSARLPNVQLGTTRLGSAH